MRRTTILIVDDEPTYLILLKGLLKSEGYEDVITEHNPLAVQEIINQNEIGLIISDVYMPKLNGLELLEIIKQSNPEIPVIMVTAVDDVEIALRATKIGAYDYLVKPPDTDRLFLTIKRALDQRLLELERDSLRKLSLNRTFPKSDFENIITNSELMYKVFELVEIFAPTNETILISGETGTGKDLIAQKIHDLSPRASGPFVVVNLASISSTLFESELFGYEKGAFTGAAAEKKGYFEEAGGGTIFLDEIGELSKELQGKLLRTIQYNEIYRIGSPKPIKLDIRIITATNRNLLDDVKNKNFRADLYYRLNRGYIQLPPLRSRKSDVIPLADYFIKAGNRIYKKNVTGLSKQSASMLLNYDFPGNIRELENIILNSIAKTSDGHEINDVDIPNSISSLSKDILKNETSLKTIDNVVADHINYVMEYAGKNVQKAASILGVSERTLQRRLQKIRGKS